MHLIWVLSLLLLYAKCIRCGTKQYYTYKWYFGWYETYHYPGYYTTPMTPFINGTDTEVADRYHTPDYRIEEEIADVYHPKMFKEQHRPYRLTPIYKQLYRGWNAYQYEGLMHGINWGCYCCCTYRRHVLLSGCAVITYRHVVTTATPTELILRSYGHRKTFENLLGGWYEIDKDTFNSSEYFTPARIHIHPEYVYDYQVNVSHPVPVMYDLSIWASTYKFYGSYFGAWSRAILCYRAASGWFEYTSSIPRPGDLATLIGYQFMKAYKRRPMPWYKFGVRTRDHVWPCPKPDWHWYHCMPGGYWGRFGFDSGGAMHYNSESKYMILGRMDGFIGMCSFSMRLRCKQITHYFTVIDTYPVLDFMYDAFLGRLKYKWLDDRFEDSQWRAPIPWWGEYIAHNYFAGSSQYVHYTEEWIHNYRR